MGSRRYMPSGIGALPPRLCWKSDNLSADQYEGRNSVAKPRQESPAVAHDPTLPTNSDQLHNLMEQVTNVASISESILTTLRDVNGDPKSLIPVEVHSFFRGWNVTRIGSSRSTMLNQDLQEMAVRSGPIIPYLKISPEDKKLIQGLLPDSQGQSDEEETCAFPVQPDLFLTGLIKFPGEPVSADQGERNARGGWENGQRRSLSGSRL